MICLEGWLYFSHIQISWRRISGLVVGEYLYSFTLVKSVGIEGEEAMAPFGLLLPGCFHVRALLQNCHLHQVLGVFTDARSGGAQTSGIGFWCFCGGFFCFDQRKLIGKAALSVVEADPM